MTKKSKKINETSQKNSIQVRTNSKSQGTVTATATVCVVEFTTHWISQHKNSIIFYYYVKNCVAPFSLDVVKINLCIPSYRLLETFPSKYEVTQEIKGREDCSRPGTVDHLES